MMTHRERMLAVLQGSTPDRLPWMPRLEAWYKARQKADTMPTKYRGWDLRSIYRDQDMGFNARYGMGFEATFEGVETITIQKGEETRREIITPVGSVSTLSRSTPELRAQGIHSLEVEHMIKGPDDYDVIAWLYEHTIYTSVDQDLAAYDMACGDDGIPQINTPWTPPGYLMSQLIGYNQAYYHLYDYPQKVERLLGIMTDRYWDMHRICAESPALIVSHGAHFHSQMTPPPVFREFYMPYLTKVSAYYHDHGKLLQFHGDADISGLEEMLLEAGYDIAECMVTDPMVPVTFEHLRQVWGNNMTIWGGIPSIILCDPFTDQECEDYVTNLLAQIGPGDAVILGIADMAMPPSKWNRIERVGELVKQHCSTKPPSGGTKEQSI